jgi:DNA invertase Pin-like site-specific DNA recombinase
MKEHLMSIDRARCAAQYLRMSTEVQDLSLAVQAAATKTYAAAHDLELIATYKDEGRSGLELKGRPGLQQLLEDVAQDSCPFSVVLVFDVSRWGRFQQTDESAYWDFHCSLHGVKVVYTNEPFTGVEAPMLALIKNLKRAMAAEYSRELGLKTRAGQDRAIDLGFQMGSLPAIGLRRVAVSKDSGRTRLLQSGERKGHQSDHIRWVRGPEEEIALVRKIFQLYGCTSLHMPAIARLINQEGHCTRDGRPFTEPMVRAILDCEAFIGNFVWSRKVGAAQKPRSETDPMFRRTIGAIEPIVDRETWDRVQTKRFWKKGVFRTRPQLLGELRATLLRNPSVTVTELPSSGGGTKASYTKMFGSMQEAFRLAGRDYAAARSRKVERQLRGWRVTRALVHDLETLLSENGLKWHRPRRQHTFILEHGLRLRIQLMWRLQHYGSPQWWLSKHFWSGPCDYFLIARMNQDETAQDFLLMPAAVYRSAPPWAWEHLPQAASLIRSAPELVEQLAGISGAPIIPTS